MKNHTKYSLKNVIACIFTLIISAILTSCTRPNGPTSYVSITLPKSTKSLNAKNLNAQFKLNSTNSTECYAISISGPGIGNSSRACGPTTGITAGFAAAGQTLTLEVPRGNDRVISVYMYYTSPRQTSCPAWNGDFDDLYGTNYNYTFKLKDISGISLSNSEESIPINVTDPTIDDLPVLSQLGIDGVCTPKISSYLNADGTITDTNGVPIPELLNLAPIAESFSLQIIGDLSLSSLIINSTSSVFFSPAGNVQLPAYLRSVIKHPIDNTKVVGMRDDGVLEEVSLSDGSSSEFTIATCPFISCEVPPWLKSITLGPDKNLYGLDQGGGFYLLNDTDPIIMADVIVPEYVEQVAF